MVPDTLVIMCDSISDKHKSWHDLQSTVGILRLEGSQDMGDISELVLVPWAHLLYES